MVTKLAAIGLTAVIALSPLAALAQTDQAAPAGGASSATAPTGTHKSQMRQRSNLSKERARASAEHMRKMRHTPPKTAPATAPKTQ
jgi:hypothetical protein